jgi:allantoin racemase
MKLLIANPNTSEAITARIAAVARAVVSPGTEIVTATARTGVPYIVTRAEAAIAACALLEMMAAHGHDCDAAVVAAFGDPGLEAARELMPVPVVGLAEASMVTACLLGRRFSLVSFAQAFVPWYRDSVERLGLIARLASIRCLDGGFNPVAGADEAGEAALAELCRRCGTEDGADVVVLAGAPLAGLAARIGARTGVRVLDGVAAATRQAEALAGLPLGRPAARAANGAAAKPVTGVSPALEAMFHAAAG